MKTIRLEEKHGYKAHKKAMVIPMKKKRGSGDV